MSWQDNLRKRLGKIFGKKEDDSGKISFHRKDTPPPQPPPQPPPPPTPPPPTPPPSGLLGRYRLLEDQELPAKYFGGKSRTASIFWLGRPMTPATCRIRGISSNGPISDLGQRMVEKLDKILGTFGYVTKPRQGWVNRGSWPNKVEGLTFEDNFVDVIKVDVPNNRGYIRLWHGEGIEDDCVVHKWTNIDKKGNISGPPVGSNTGYIVLDYSGPKWGDGTAWIELDKMVKV